MALTLQILPGSGAASPSAGRSINYVAAVTNAGSSSVTLLALSVFSDLLSCSVVQPVINTNAAPGSGPVLTAGSTTYFPFSLVTSSPSSAGPSPQAGALGNGATPTDSTINLTMQSTSSDGTTASATYFLPVLSPGNFKYGEGGSLQMSQGANAVNLLTTFL